jgi:alkyl sulfatase BDS1-like metallo-beta-lactamase superfamily hydrolase
MSDDAQDRRKNASAATRAANDALVAALPFEDRRDFEEATRGLVAPLSDSGVIKAADGRPVWDLSAFSFIEQGADAPGDGEPESVAPVSAGGPGRPVRGRAGAVSGADRGPVEHHVR